MIIQPTVRISQEPIHLYKLLDSKDLRDNLNHSHLVKSWAFALLYKPTVHISIMQIHQATRLLQETCALKHLSINTEKSYTHWLLRYSSFLKGPKSNFSTTEQKLEAFLTNLALSGVSASTQNQAFNALLFFYRDVLKRELTSIDSLRAKRPAALRHCPTREEVLQILSLVADIYGYPTRLIVHLLYGCGLRVCEPLNLRIKDIDIKQRRVYIHHSKGGKGRVVLFPECLAPALERQLTLAKARAAQDHASRIPVALPGLLAKKYPYAAHAERWAWLFPSHSLCRDPRAKILVRWRCHEANVQRAVKIAAERCHLQGLTPHYLRHAFATHALQGGAFVRDLQVVLGHNHLETTMLYLHAEAGRVVSPLQDYAPKSHMAAC
jgi:integron integrase